MNSTTHRQNTDYEKIRKPQPPRRIFCYNCQEYTLSTEPITVRRYANYKFHVVAMCEKCQKLKSCSIRDSYRCKFPPYFFDIHPGNIVENVLDGKRIIEEISSIINE